MDPSGNNSIGVIVFELEDHIKKCREIIEGDNRNTIANLINDIMYYDSLYRAFNEALRLDTQNLNKPNTIIDFIHQSFFEGQTLRIRRLLDEGKDTYSLKRLFNDIKNNAHLYTREKYILLENVNYEIDKNVKFDELRCIEQHKKYDAISGVSAEKRKKNDRLNNNYINQIEQYLLRPNIIVQYSTTYIAHSLNTKKQLEIYKSLPEISLRTLQKNYKLLSWLSYTLSFYCNTLILFEVPGVLFDQFENWGGTIFSKNIEKKLYRYSENRSRMYKNWQDKYWMKYEMYLNPYKKAKKDI